VKNTFHFTVISEELAIVKDLAKIAVCLGLHTTVACMDTYNLPNLPN